MMINHCLVSCRYGRHTYTKYMSQLLLKHIKCYNVWTMTVLTSHSHKHSIKSYIFWMSNEKNNILTTYCWLWVRSSKNRVLSLNPTNINYSINSLVNNWKYYSHWNKEASFNWFFFRRDVPRFLYSNWIILLKLLLLVNMLSEKNFEKCKNISRISYKFFLQIASRMTKTYYYSTTRRRRRRYKNNNNNGRHNIQNSLINWHCYYFVTSIL